MHMDTKEAGSMGGKKAAENMSADERRERARKAGSANKKVKSDLSTQSTELSTGIEKAT